MLNQHTSPDDGEDHLHPQPKMFTVGDISQEEQSRKQNKKRIVMNPPQQFIASAAAAAPPPVQAAVDLINSNGNGALMISQNGQAVMQPQTQAQSSSSTTTITSNSNSNSSPDANVPNHDTQTTPETQLTAGQVILEGSAVVLQDSVPPTTVSSATATATATPTSTSSSSSLTTIIVSSTPSTTSAVTSTAATADSSTSTTSASQISSTPSLTSNTVPSTVMTISTDVPASTTAASSSTVLTITSYSSSSFSATSSATASASSLPSSSNEHHAPSAGIIFVIILACLVIFGIVASSLSFLFRSRRLGRRFRVPCMNRDDDDDDGLSDLVRGFESPASRHESIRSHRDMSGYAGAASTSAFGYGAGVGAGAVGLGLGLGTAHMANMHPHESYGSAEAEADEALQRRSSLFAEDPSASPFLHSASMAGIGSHGGYSLPLPPPIAHGNSGTATMYPLPYSRGGAPSIAVPLPSHLMGETGPLEVRNGMPDDVEGNDGVEGLQEIGLDSASPRFLGLDGNGLETPWSRTLPPRPDEIDNTVSHLPLPPAMTTHNTSQPPYGAFASPAPSVHEDIPQQSATWASNLRSTLFAAISAVKPPSANTEDGDDRFTRTVGMVYRASTRRRNGRNGPVDVEKAQGDGGFPIVVEEKDDQNATAIGSIFLCRLESTSSAETLTPPPRSAAERYKHYYAHSKSSLSLSAAATSEGGNDSAVESIAEVRRPPVLAGGARAKGARTGSFVVA